MAESLFPDIPGESRIVSIQLFALQETAQQSVAELRVVVEFNTLLKLTSLVFSTLDLKAG